MASFFRSISTKIFGVALGLLILMLIASLWSASSTQRVNRQLKTLSEAIVPLALTLEDIRSEVLEEYIILHRHSFERRDLAGCRREFDAQAVIVDRYVARATDERDLGGRLAVSERSKLEFARMKPLIDQVREEHRRLKNSAAQFCSSLGAAGASAQAFDVSEDRSEELRGLVAAISAEIEAFALESSAIVESNERRAMQANLVLIGISSLVGLMLAFLVSRGLTRPIARLREGARAVQLGSLDGDVPVTSRDEIGDVTLAFNEMLDGLRMKERIKATFGQYVDPRIVAELIDGKASRSSSGEKQVATLFFSDIAGFTSIAERLAPAALVALVNDYFATMSDPIRERSGIIDKYIGDSIMAFWVPPFVEPADQAASACAAALEQLERLDDFRARVPDLIGLRRDVPTIDMRMAIASGEVVVGSIGPEYARSFTVMGDTVNFASRLEGANKVYGTRILIDEATRLMAGEAIEVREIDLVQVVGRSEPLRLFELAALAGATDSPRDGLFALYAEGLAAYRAGNWDEAQRALGEALRLSPTDGPSLLLLDRVARFMSLPPPDWDGIWRLTSK